MFIDGEIGGRGVRWVITDPVSKWRVDTLLTKEPETIRWLEKIPQGSTIYDVGANIGIYTVYAAALGHKVVAFEPVAERTHSLIETLKASGLSAEVVTEKVGSIDRRVANGLPRPTHIKIDTDGDDLAVVLGARGTLPHVQSVIVETNTRREAERDAINAIMREAGLEFTGRYCCPLVTSKKIGMDHYHRP